MKIEPKVLRGKVRTVDVATGKVAKNANRKPLDGGGWPTNKKGWGMARRQSMHVNEDE